MATMALGRSRGRMNLESPDNRLQWIEDTSYDQDLGLSQYQQHSGFPCTTPNGPNRVHDLTP